MKSEIYHLVRTALAFGKIERGVNHPDGTPETDTDHTVSLAWLACSLAEALYPGKLDVGLIAQYAIVHDAVEVYAGDLYAVNATDADRTNQKRREHEAAIRLRNELPSLPWLVNMIEEYEAQVTPESRFTWAVDKLMPKIVLRLEGTPKETLLAHGVDRESVRRYRAYERRQFEERIPDFAEILSLREELHALLTLGDEDIV